MWHLARLCKGSLVSSSRRVRFPGAIREFLHLLHVVGLGWYRPFAPQFSGFKIFRILIVGNKYFAKCAAVSYVKLVALGSVVLIPLS